MTKSIQTPHAKSRQDAVKAVEQRIDDALAEKAAACEAALTKRLIKCNADPACLPPNDVTVVIAVLDVEHKIE